MENSSIKKNFAYKSILTVSSYLMAFVTFPYVSRVLGVEILGLVNFVDNTVNYFLLFATMGIALLGVREIAAVKDAPLERDRIFSNILGLNLLFTLGALVIYFLAISLIPQLRQYSKLFYIGGAKILFTTFLVEWFFTGIEHFRYITIRSIIIKILYVIAIFCLIRTPDDYKLYFILTVGVVVSNALVNIAYVRKFVHIRLEYMISKKYAKQNLSLGIYSIMTSMYLTFNVMFLGLVSNNTEVGYYTTAYKLYTVVLSLFTAFTNVMLPRMSSLLANGEKERFQQLINKSFTVMSTFSIPLILYCIILTPQIVYVLSGEGYEGAVLPMRIIMPAIFFVGVAQVLAIQILMPMKKDRVLLLVSIVGAILSLFTNFILVPSLESTGTAIVLLSSEVIVTSLYIVYCMSFHFGSISFMNVLNNFLYSIPSVIICIACSLFIENPFIVLFISMVLVCFCFIFIHTKQKTYVGNMISKHLYHE